MVPISEGKGDPGKGLVRGGGGCQFTPVTHVLVFMATGVWSPGGGKKKQTKKKRRLVPLQADLPPGIDQKQINFHFQLGTQLNPKW